MRLPWRRRREDATGRSAADDALEFSERQHEQARRRRYEFERVARRMRELREVNHLAEAFEQAFREGRR